MVPELEKMELLDGQLGLKKRKSRDRDLLGRMFWLIIMASELNCSRTHPPVTPRHPRIIAWSYVESAAAIIMLLVFCFLIIW
ncbi:hypothetical protein ACS0TY_008837 [Phlomoides rotata]